MDLDTYLVLVLLVSISDGIGMDWTILKLNTCSDLSKIGLNDILVKPNMIDLLLHILRMGKLRGKITIVGKEEHTCSVAVKTAYWIDTLLACIVYKVKHGLTALRIVACGHCILWLIEKHIDLTLKAYRLIVEEDSILASYLGAKFGYNLAIDLDAAIGNVLIGLTT